MQPCILRSKRLLIRSHREEDQNRLNRAILDSFQELQPWMDWSQTPQTLAETKAYIEYSQECWKQDAPKELPLLIFDSGEQNLIGSSGFLALDWHVPMLEIGYWVNVSQSGCGYITEAVNILTRYAFQTWGVKRVEIRCDSENEKSANIARKLGFGLEAHFKNHRIQPYSKKLSGTLVFARYDVVGMPQLSFSHD